MILTRFEALGLLPSRAEEFDLYAQQISERNNRVRVEFLKYKRLSLEGLLARFDFASPVNLVYCSDQKRPFLKFQDATYLRPDKRKLRRFVLLNRVGNFEVI